MMAFYKQLSAPFAVSSFKTEHLGVGAILYEQGCEFISALPGPHPLPVESEVRLKSTRASPHLHRSLVRIKFQPHCVSRNAYGKTRVQSIKKKNRWQNRHLLSFWQRHSLTPEWAKEPIHPIYIRRLRKVMRVSFPLCTEKQFSIKLELQPYVLTHVTCKDTLIY